MSLFQDIYDVIVVGAGHAGSEAAAAAAEVFPQLATVISPSDIAYITRTA